MNSFFEDIDRIFAPNWLPTDQDILRTRLRTTGINEATFNTGSLTYKMYDVGGQRSERKKWIHVFDNVQVVMFLAAISGYDQSLIEDRKGVRHSPSITQTVLTMTVEPNERSSIPFRADFKLAVFCQICSHIISQQDRSIPRKDCIRNEPNRSTFPRLPW
jgi:hypothetical protein